MSRVRTILADDFIPLRDVVQMAISEWYEVVAAVSDGHAAVAQAQALQPELILLDISLPLLNGIQTARQLRRTVPDAKLLFLTQQKAADYIQAAFRAGARGYVLKDGLGSELLLALKEISAGRYYVTPRLMGPAVQAAFDPAKNPGELFGNGISSLQKSILRALQNGKTNEEIARDLQVNVTRVISETENLAAEWNASDTAELIRYGLSTGLLPPDR